MVLLVGQVALVTGASRGIGRGIAIELAREGATVALAARTMSPTKPARVDGDGIAVRGSLEETIEQITAEGGTAHAFPCDLSHEREIGTLVKEISDRCGRIDILVNNGMPQHTMTGRFWELPSTVFDDQMTIGPRSYFLTARLCAPIMIEQGSGIIVNISSPGSCVDFYSAAYCIARAASDRMAQAFSTDLNGTGVRAYSLWPSFIRTERLMMAVEGQPVGYDVPEGFDPTTEANSPEIVGRAITHLAVDKNDTERNGTVVTLAELAEKYGFKDTDGRAVVRLPALEYVMGELGRVFPLAYAKITK
jgi:dehydrogenase/reductase SDR family protein 1